MDVDLGNMEWILDWIWIDFVRIFKPIGMFLGSGTGSAFSPPRMGMDLPIGDFLVQLDIAGCSPFSWDLRRINTFRYF